MAMQYKAKYKSDLICIDYRYLNKERLIDLFSENGYDYLYVFKDEKFYGIVTFRDVIRGWDGQVHKGDIICEKKNITSPSDVEKFFFQNPAAERMVIVDEDDVYCEIDPMVEPPLQNNSCKNIMALRYVPFFQENIEKTLGVYHRILIISSKELYKLWKRIFPKIKVDHIEHIIEIKHKSYDLIFDFKYGKKLMKATDISGNIVDFCQIIERIALDELLEYGKNNGILIKFYKLPRYDDLKCLNELEEYNRENRVSVAEVAANEKYMQAFTQNKNEYDFIKSRKFNYSLRLDDGYAYVMESCEDDDIVVNEGVRRSLPILDNPKVSLHFFGPCTTYGMLVPDHETVESCLIEEFKKSGLNILTVNHGGLHGNNVLNSIILALSSKVKSGDGLIFLDVLDDFNAKWYPGLLETAEWFNEEKSKSEVYFFDFPGHCNHKAYKILAKRIKDDIMPFIHGTSGEIFNFLTKKGIEYDCMEYIETYAPIVKMMNKLRKDSFTGNNIGAFVINLTDEENVYDDKIRMALRYCAQLYLFMSGENLNGFSQVNLIKELKERYNHYDNIKIFQIEHGVNSMKYAKLLKKYPTLHQNISKIELALCKGVFLPLNVKWRFYFKEDTDKYRGELNMISQEACKSYSIKTMEL